MVVVWLKNDEDDDEGKRVNGSAGRDFLPSSFSFFLSSSSSCLSITSSCISHCCRAIYDKNEEEVSMRTRFAILQLAAILVRT